MKRTVPLIIASTAGFVMIVAYFIPITQTWGDMAGTWFNILAAVALILGGGNLMKLQLKQVSEQKPGWGYAAVTLIVFVVTTLVGLLKVGVHPNEEFPGHPWSGDWLQEGGAIWWSYEYIINPITATMFGMLAFYIASAAFRAFRAKNLEATLLLATAVIVLLGRTYIGVLATDWLPEWLAWLKFNRMTEFIQDVFNTSGTRAITIGIALGAVATSLKILLGLDQSYLGAEE